MFIMYILGAWLMGFLLRQHVEYYTFSHTYFLSCPSHTHMHTSSLTYSHSYCVQEHREVIPLVYSSDCKSTQQQGSPVSRRAADNGAGVRGEEKKASMAHPRQRRPLVSRNRLAAGLGKKLPQKGPLKPMVGHVCIYRMCCTLKVYIYMYMYMYVYTYGPSFLQFTEYLQVLA